MLEKFIKINIFKKNSIQLKCFIQHLYTLQLGICTTLWTSINCVQKKQKENKRQQKRKIMNGSRKDIEIYTILFFPRYIAPFFDASAGREVCFPDQLTWLKFIVLYLEQIVFYLLKEYMKFITFENKFYFYIFRLKSPFDS